jgi:DNA polymerase-1
VATILRDVPLDVDLSSLQFGDYSAEDIHETFMRYGLRSAYNWMAKLAKGSNELASSDFAEQEQEVIKAELNSPYKGVIVDLSGETLFDTEQVLVAAGVDDDSPTLVTAASIAADLAQLLQSDEYIAAPNLKALFTKVATPNNTITPVLDPKKFDSTGNFDLSIAAYLLASFKKDFSLKELALEHAHVDLDALSENETNNSDAIELAKEKATLVARLAAILENRLDRDGSLELYREIELPLIPVLARMEHAGITIDLAKLDELAQCGRAQIETLRKEIFELAGTDDFNLDSPKQLAEILFDRLELPVIKKTRTGRSTNAAVLAELCAHHPIAAKITEYREFNKLQNTYLEALPKLVATDGRIHTSFNQTVTATGRLSSSSPNLQNIPVRTEMGRRIREAFVPSRQAGEEGWKLVSVDYSQIELRVLAQLSKDAGLIEAFNSGEDFHAETATRLFGLSSEQAQAIDPALRSKAKAVNFGIIYGQGPHGLAKVLDLSYGEAKQIIDRYYATFPRVKAYLDETIHEAKMQGWAKTYFGRKRHIPELLSSNRAIQAFGERTAMNHPMQGTAADLIKIAMIAVDERLRQSELKARMLLQVHDELVFEAPANECDRLRELVSEVMTKVAPEFVVPLEVNVAVGDTWACAK